MKIRYFFSATNSIIYFFSVHVRSSFTSQINVGIDMKYGVRTMDLCSIKLCKWFYEWIKHVPFIIVNTKHNASFVSYAYARFTTNLELIFCRICFSISTIDSPLRFLIRFFSNFLHAYIFPVARTCTNKQNGQGWNKKQSGKWKIEFIHEWIIEIDWHSACSGQNF